MSKISTEVYDGLVRCLNEFAIPDAVFKFSIEKVCEELKKESVKKKLTVSGAESITGGMIASLLTSVPGSSDYFLGAAVTYSVSSKINILCIDKEVLNYKGVVSEWTAREMAIAARRIYKSKIAYGVTGYAGPRRGDEDREIGTVCFGFSMPDRNITWTQKFTGERNDVRKSASEFVILTLLIIALNHHILDETV